MAKLGGGDGKEVIWTKSKRTANFFVRSSLNVVVNDDHVDNDVNVDHLNLGSKNSDTRATMYINMRKRVTTFTGIGEP